jgi:hypothetical protein
MGDAADQLEEYETMLALRSPDHLRLYAIRARIRLALRVLAMVEDDDLFDELSDDSDEACSDAQKYYRHEILRLAREKAEEKP